MCVCVRLCVCVHLCMCVCVQMKAEAAHKMLENLGPKIEMVSTYVIFIELDIIHA